MQGLQVVAALCSPSEVVLIDRVLALIVPLWLRHPRQGISIVVLAALPVADGKIVFLDGQHPPCQQAFHFLG